MKGIIDIEYILAVAVFLTTISFVTLVIMSNVPLFHKEAVSEDLRSRAYEVSQLLLFDKGYPSGWNIADVERLGLSKGERYNISLSSVLLLENLCGTDYIKTKALLGQDYRNDLTIEITDSDNNILVSCAPPVITSVRPKFQITRFAMLDDGKLVKMVLGVT